MGSMSRKTPVRVIRSGLTGTVYALTRYRQREDGLITVIGEGKHDVTADVEALVAERCAPLVECLERIARIHHHDEPLGAGNLARAALAAYRAAQGAGRGTE
jgi:hypothetical protein